MMQILKTEISGVFIIEPGVFEDSRGFFKETYERNRYADAGLAEEFVQDNLSRSCRGTLRGMHYQIQHPQAKLVQVFQGEIFDVAVDLRRNSPQFGKWVGIRLSESNHRQLYVPEGFAHGFCVLSDEANVAYKVTGGEYTPDSERGVIWNDPDIGIRWPLGTPLISERDAMLPPLKEADHDFVLQEVSP